MAKKSFIVRLFDDIAPTYDKLNHILSLNIDKSWRSKSVKQVLKGKHDVVLDIACGTGDFSIELAQKGVEKVIGVDISEGMMKIGMEKSRHLDSKIRSLCMSMTQNLFLLKTIVLMLLQ